MVVVDVVDVVAVEVAVVEDTMDEAGALDVVLEPEMMVASSMVLPSVVTLTVTVVMVPPTLALWLTKSVARLLLVTMVLLNALSPFQEAKTPNATYIRVVNWFVSF